ncbi:unnamed protein product [marine sediment metagenome]|uniref:Uncharacterized protein n=1 Tax=marine sediment metagenome TaxID=412755 RepID=X1RK51_9ZZZZ
MPEKTVRQEEIAVGKSTFTVTHIPTATSGSWYTVHDVCEVWGAVAIDDLTGEVIGWRSPPGDDIRWQVEKAIKDAFGIPVQF